jgi:aminomethyltransferase
LPGVPATLRSPLHDVQERHGATFSEFAGAWWAGHFGDPVAEHHAVRTAAGVWDISPLRIWEVRSPGAAAAVDRVFTNDVTGAAPGRIRYGALCDEHGAMVNDSTVYVLAADRVWLITSLASDGAHLAAHLPGVAPAGELAKVQVQGPRSRDLLAGLGAPVAGLAYFHVATEPVDVAGVACRLSRIGFSGELGYELFCAPADAETLWARLVGAGARPYGLAAVETLRIEAGLPLLGAEFDSRRTSPYDLSLDAVVRPGKPGLVGREALAAAAAAPPRRLVALVLDGAAVPPRGAAVWWAGARVGTVTSACASPTLGGVIALAVVAAGAAAAAGDQVEVGPDRAGAVVRPVPLYDPAKGRPRA